VDDEKKFWVGFNLVKGVGAVRMRVLLDSFGSAEKAWNASQESLEISGLPTKIVQSIINTRNSDKLDRVWDYLIKNDIEVIMWADKSYPRRLVEIEQPPPVLYIRGNLIDADQWAVAVVGTRRVTPYGSQVAEEIAGSLASNGITIVSGLARGTDAIAHQAALNKGGRTLAILGNGVDRIYPPEHRKLAERIITQGALISDYPPGTAPESSNFPPRNRIISGLSQAVIVVEAGEKSGALITAAFAIEQGREVFAVPGNIHAVRSKGTNLLIREGAHILLDSQDVLETLNFAQISQQRVARATLPSNSTEAHLYEILGHEPLHIDEIRAKSDLPIEQVTATLTFMELKGMIRQVGSMNYIAVLESKGDYQIETLEQDI